MQTPLPPSAFRIRLSVAVAAIVLLPACATVHSSSRPPDREIEILYATDRRPEHRGGYANERGDSLIYGFVPVRIWEDPKLKTDSARAYEAPKKMELGRPTPMPKEAFFERLRSEITRRKYHHSFTYIHGYSNNFEAAVSRTALIERGLDFGWVGVAYDWPSYDTHKYYVGDLDQARWTFPHLRSYFAGIAQNTEPDGHSVAAHSMGNQALSWALESDVAWPGGVRPHFAAIAMLDPDIDPDLLTRDHLPMLRTYARRITLYGDTKDRPLRLAAEIRAGKERAGMLPAGRFVSDSIDVIDITDVAGHSFMHHADHLRGTTLVDLMLSMLTGTSMECRLDLRTGEWDKAKQRWALYSKWKGPKPGKDLQSESQNGSCDS